MKNSESKKTKWGGVWRPLAGLLGLGAIVVWSAGACNRKVAAGRVEAGAGFAAPAGAETITVEESAFAERIDLVGTAQSEERIHVSARLPAYVKAVHVSAGDRVKKGQELVSLDDREIREQLGAAESQFRQAETEYKRAKQLFESKATTDQALTAAESMYNSVRAQLEQAKVMLSYATLTSPIDGIVTDRRIEAGDLANPGQVLMAVYDPERMRLEVAAPMRMIERLALGQPVEIALDRPSETFAGRIAEIVSEVDPMSRTQKVRARIERGDANILPGTFGRMWVACAERPAVLVPEEAVYRVGQLEMVQKVRDGRVVRRVVRTGRREGGRVEILGGLKAGEAILARPIQEG